MNVHKGEVLPVDREPRISTALVLGQEQRSLLCGSLAFSAVCPGLWSENVHVQSGCHRWGCPPQGSFPSRSEYTDVPA